MNIFTAIKIALAIALAIALLAEAYHLGGDGPRAAMALYEADQSRAIANAVLTERAAAAATAAQDHATELTHAQVIVQIDSAPAIHTPVLLCPPGAVRAGAVPGTQGQTGGVPADPAAGRGEPVGGRDIRPVIEALKKRLEKVMADYRQLDAEWPYASN